MKIGLENAPVSPAGTHSQHLAKLLARYAPEHEFVLGDEHLREVDIYHGFRPRLPLAVWVRRVPSVMTVRNLDFLRHPEAYSLAQRIFLLRMYKQSIRAATRLITLSRSAREELAERMRIDPRKIEVVMPLAAAVASETPAPEACEAVRRKYELPENFILMLGTVEPRHHHEDVFEAVLSAGIDASVVVCGRRTVYSQFLLGYARQRRMATHVEFLYEISPEDLPALFRLARAFVYLPEAQLEASIVPVVEAMRAGVPMVLSDTPLNREAAADAAVYVRTGAEGELAAALENALYDEDFRAETIAREQERAKLFSEYAVAQRLIDIYSSL